MSWGLGSKRCVSAGFGLVERWGYFWGRRGLQKTVLMGWMTDAENDTALEYDEHCDRRCKICPREGQLHHEKRPNHALTMHAS